jgi:hypothetical protein
LLTSTSIDGRSSAFCKRDEVIDDAVTRLSRLTPQAESVVT